uniref:Uncharacterized protein n=1 Tax=Arundo donax TaxID=35708 RepID=A0A0A9A2D1_ARUDO
MLIATNTIFINFYMQSFKLTTSLY